MKIQALILSLLALTSAAMAQSSNVPALISYSGKVVDASGNAITGQRLMTFRVWNHPTDAAASNRLWSEQQTVVLSAGEFSVLIGAGSAVAGETNTGVFADAFNGSTRYLGVTVDDGTAAVDPEISPRQQVVTTAFAFRSRVAETVASGGVTSSMLSSAAVNEAALATAAVSAAKLADASVQTAKIADGSVTTAKLADGSVTSAKMAGGQISAGVLTDGSLGTAKLADGSVNSAKIADGSVALVDLAANSVDATKLTDGSVTLTKHADNSVNSAKIVDGSVSAVDLAASSVDSGKLTDGAVTTAKLGANSVTIQKMANDAVDRSKLHPTVRAAIGRAPEVYNQAVRPDYETNTNGVYNQLVPIDIENLGNDADGCRILIIGKHRKENNNLWEWSDEWEITEVRIHLTQRGMLSNGDFTSGQYIPGNSVWYQQNGTRDDYFWLGITDLSTHWSWAHTMGSSYRDWYYLYTFYPGSQSPGLASPWNVNQANNASNVNNGGPPVDMNINSITAENGVVTVVTRTGHAIQTGNTVTISGVTGAGSASLPDPNGGRVVTAVPSRNSFQFNLSNANGTYSGGWTPELDSAGHERLPLAGYKLEPGAAVRYQPTYSKFRLWLAVHRNTSARVIVYDN
ncbi:MAG: hypothetical protein RIR76_2411 [Verrucomicrobiota bacterium]|jgi:hypothetical protein